MPFLHWPLHPPCIQNVKLKRKNTQPLDRFYSLCTCHTLFGFGFQWSNDHCDKNFHLRPSKRIRKANRKIVQHQSNHIAKAIKRYDPERYISFGKVILWQKVSLIQLLPWFIAGKKVSICRRNDMPPSWYITLYIAAYYFCFIKRTTFTKHGRKRFSFPLIKKEQ